MPVKYLRLLARTTLLLVLCGALGPVHAAETPYPSRPIRLIVAVAPGGGTDIISRLIAARLTESLGQTVIVDNRGGGNFIIGTNLAAKALPDGHT
ncbi:MAG: Bug family tripartite tricarboxylate transporter substrate binding protein, partial [Burkholderiales bacterium]